MKVKNITIKLERYGSHGWQWTESYTNPITGTKVSGQYRTDGFGAGLWQWQRSGAIWHDTNGDTPVYEYKQIAGTCQFGLSAERSAAYSKIRRAIEGNYNF